MTADAEIPKGYKLTEVGVIPEDWEVFSIRDLVRQGPKNGYSGRSSDNTAGTPTLSLAATSGGRLILNDTTVKYLEKRIAPDSALYLEPGDVLVQRSNTAELVGTTAIYNGPTATFVYPDLMMRLRFRQSATGEWFWRHANSRIGRHFFRSVAAGSTGSMPKISGEKLRGMPLPIPPINERDAITEALSDADALVESLEQLLAKKRQLKQGAMQELLTGKKRLPGFSGEWEVKRLGDHVTFLRHGVNSRAELMAEGSVKYLHYGDIHTAAEVLRDPSTSQMPRLPIDRAKALDRLQDGDLVLVDASEDLEGIGKSVEVKGVRGEEVVSGLHTIAARFDKTVLADGFKAYLQFCPTFLGHLRRLAAGTKVYATNRTHIASLEISLPDIEEQTAIAAVLSDMDAEIAALEAKLAKARSLKQGMMQELLTGRIRLV